MRRRLPHYVRGACLLAAIAILWLANDTQLPVVVEGMSPFVAMASILTTRSIGIVSCLGLVVGGVVLFRSHWFCRWICPTGHCADAVSRAGQGLGRRAARCPHFGRWILWITLGGALLGWPLLLWLDPLAIFGAIFTPLTRTPWAGAWLTMLPALLVFLVSLAWPRIWCRRLCPLGALQDDLARLAGTGRRLLRRRDCRQSTPGDAPAVTRRAVLGVVAGTASAAALRLQDRTGPGPLRPPGAISEPDFFGLCVRCGNCSRACPSHIIRPDPGTHGLAGFLAPVLGFDRDYCREDCVACTEVCPSGALGTLAIDDKPAIRIGRPEVNLDICLLAEDRECSECRRWCPYDAVRYEFSEESYSLAPRIDPDRCNGCGACQTACPTKPQKAIMVAKLPA